MRYSNTIGEVTPICSAPLRAWLRPPRQKDKTVRSENTRTRTQTDCLRQTGARGETDRRVLTLEGREVA